MKGLPILLVAIAFEVFGSTALRLADGFRHLGWAAASLFGFTVALGLLSVAMRHLPLGVSFATWAGVGTAGAVAVGVWLFGERLAPLQLLAVAVILGGVGLLHLSAPKP